MIDDLALRWVVTILFAVSAAECLYALATHRMRVVPAVGHVLHAVMSIAMIAMAWPAGMDLPTTGPMIFFLAAAVWFAAVGMVVATTAGDRIVDGYHAVMMAAMAWMYAVMNGDLLPGQSGHAHGGGHDMGSSMDMPGVDMSGMDMSGGSSDPGWITIINAILALGFAAAAVYWLYRYFAQRAQTPGTQNLLPHWGTLCQGLMAAGMAIMFAVML